MKFDSGTWALVVGIEEYDFGIPLPGATAAVVHVAKLLWDRGVKPNQTSLCLSPNSKSDGDEPPQGAKRFVATFTAMRKLLERDLCAGSGQLLCVFWAGHGAVDGHAR